MCLTLTLTDDLKHVSNRKVLSQGIIMSNMKALTVTNQKDMANEKVFVDIQTDKPKTICPPDLSMPGA